MENTFEHLVQPKGFSPVWTLKWTCRLAFLANDLKHTEQQKFLSPVWTVKWRRKLDSWEYTCEHFGHPQGFSLEWTFKWSCRWLSWVSAAVIPRIHSAPASPLKLPLLNEMILYTAGQIFDSLVVYSIVPTVTHQADIAQQVPGNIAENLVKQFRDKQCPRVDEFFLFHTFWSDLKDRYC